MTNNIKVLAQYVKESSFKVANAPQVFLNKQEKPNIEISIDLDVAKISKKEDLFENIIKIKAKASVENEEVFFLEVSYAGIFALSNIEEGMIEQVLLIYCPNLLFPYLRQTVSNTVALGGFAPLMLEPIDFAALYAKKKMVENAAPINKTKN
jgi:preprotein translocase subunit SecB